MSHALVELLKLIVTGSLHGPGVAHCPINRHNDEHGEDGERHESVVYGHKIGPLSVISTAGKVHRQAETAHVQRDAPIREVLIEAAHSEDVVPGEEQDDVHDQEEASGDVAP